MTNAFQFGHYRKRPIVISAVQVPPKGDPVGWKRVHNFLESGGADWRFARLGAAVEIETLEGTMRAEAGDWIIRGVKGEFYPCKPDVFEQTYEEVT